MCFCSMYMELIFSRGVLGMAERAKFDTTCHFQLLMAYIKISVMKPKGVNRMLSRLVPT